MKNQFFFQKLVPSPVFLFFPFFFFLSSFFRFCSSLPFSVAAPITINRRPLPAAALLCFFFSLSLAQQNQAAADRSSNRDGRSSGEGSSSAPFFPASSGTVIGVILKLIACTLLIPK